MEHVLIAGGSGHIGSALALRLINEQYRVSILGRSNPQLHPRISYVHWDGKSAGEWTATVDASDVVINLCGKPVACRYTASNKRKLISSRVDTTTLIGNAIAKSATPPRLWINASSSAYYGFSSQVIGDDGHPGDDFPAHICVEWEKSFGNIATRNTRKVLWRLGIVLQANRGLIKPFVGLSRAFLGGSMGSGDQYFTWIDETDFLQAALWTIRNPEASGSYNLTSPAPVTNTVFMDELRQALRVPFGVSLPAWLLKIGGKIIGIEPYLILDGRRIIPSKLIDQGFVFQYPDIGSSLQKLFRKGTMSTQAT